MSLLSSADGRRRILTITEADTYEQPYNLLRRPHLYACLHPLNVPTYAFIPLGLTTPKNNINP